MASKVVLTHLNLEGNEIQNVSLQKLATDPTAANLKNGMLWANTSSNALLKYNDNGAIRTLLWSSGLGDGQTLTGGTTAGGNLTLQSTSHATKGSIVIPEFNSAGFVKNDASGNITGGNILVSTDLDASFFSTDATLGGSSTSDTKISSQKAIKTYVDNAVTGLSWKEAVVVATTGNITLSGAQTIDTIAVVAGDRVLVKNQTDKKTNGIYIVASGAWERATDANTANELVRASVFVESGTQGNTGWTCSNTSITEWSTDIEFIQFSGAGTYTGGTGIDIIGNGINIDNTVVTLTGTQTLTNKTLTDNVIVSLYQDAGKTNKISFPAVTDTVVTLAATQTLTNKTLTTPTLTTPTIANFSSATHDHLDNEGGGTLTDAVFTTAIGTTKGGTGLTSYALGDIIYGSGVNTLAKLAGNTTTTAKMLVQTGNGAVSSAPLWTKFEHQQTIGDGTNTDYVITHNLNSRGVKISVWRTTTPYDEVDYYAEKTSVNTITLRFNRIITADEFSVSISI